MKTQFAAVIVTCLLTIASPMNAEENMPTISVQGTADIRVVPDEGVLTFSIESREKDMDAAVAKTDKHVREVIEFLTNTNVESKYVRTQVLRIKPIYDERRQLPGKAQVMQNAAPQVFANDKDFEMKLLKPVGYLARRQLSVTIKQLDRFEEIYRGLLKRGVNEISGIQFQSSELRKHKDEARKRAVIAAREKAEAMASELGASLAAVQSISEIQHSYGYSNNLRNFMTEAPGTAATAIGLIEIKATVSVVFRLGDTDM